jgi:serine/threonine-protein kinase HipA
MADRLVAWLYGTPVAELSRAANYRIALEWRAEALDRWGAGSRVLSVGLPLGLATGPRDNRGLDFFENILPEGPTLTRMAALAQVRPVDTFGVLAAFGRDCAGAIVVLPEGEAPDAGGESGYTPVAADGLARVIAALDVAPLAAAPDRGFRPSLAGFQRKALVGRAPDGTWQLPYGDAPSTWILKPDGPHPMAANEATCLRLARTCDLDVPDTGLLSVGGLAVLAIKRYDRSDSPAGPARIHQEDGCQATATPPGQKYQEQGGPSLLDLARVIRDFGDPRDVAELLRRATFNMAVGNADAHAKNFSLLHGADDPIVRLAPFYDVLSTMALEIIDGDGSQLHADTHMGQHVGGQADIRKVTSGDLISEGVSWGIRRRIATAVVTEMIDHVISASSVVDADERVLGVIRAAPRTQCLRRGPRDPGWTPAALGHTAGVGIAPRPWTAIIRPLGHRCRLPLVTRQCIRTAPRAHRSRSLSGRTPHAGR